MSDELRQRMSSLRKQILILEYDRKQRQINPAKLAKLKILKKEMEQITGTDGE